MAKRKISFERVREIGLTLTGVEESTAYGSPALKLKGKLLACIPTHRSAEPGSLAVCVSFEERDALIAEEPEIYYVKEHYLNYNCVLVRLNRVTADMLRDILGMAYKFVSQKAKKRSRSKKSTSPP
jgi:hypothetical protein